MFLKRLPVPALVLTAIVFGFSLLVAVMAFDISRNPDFENALWIAEKHGVLKIATADGKSLLEIKNIKGVKKIAVDSTNGMIWVARKKTLERYSFNGELQLSFEYLIASSSSKRKSSKGESYDDDDKDEHDYRDRDDHDEWDIDVLIADPYDGSVWLGLEDTVYHYNTNMELLASISLEDDLKALAPVSEKGHIWIATEEALTRYSLQLDEEQAKAVLTNNDHDHDDDDEVEISDIAYDVTLEQLWVAADNKLIRINAEGHTVFSKRQKKIKGLAADGHGNVWLNLKKTLLYLDEVGNELVRINPFEKKKDKAIRYLVSDPANGSVWLAGKSSILNIDTQGIFQHVIKHDDKIRDIALYSDIVAPVVRLLFPQQGDYINNSQPLFQVSYEDSGIGVDATTLAFNVNGTDISVTCEKMLEDANCSPTAPLPEGTNHLQVTVDDFAGNQSKPAQVNFVVDTISPEFITISPEDGIYTNTPALTLSGKSNEAGSVSITHNETSVIGIDLDNQFAFEAVYTLIEGSNTFEIILADLAGNTTQTSLIAYLDTIPPQGIQQTTLSPIVINATGATITGAVGSVESNATVVVVNKRTGEEFTVEAAEDGSFSITVAAEEGDELEIYVKDKAENISEKLTVVAEAPLEIKITYPVNGAVFEQDTTQVIGTFKGPINSGITVNGAIAAVAGESFYLNNLSLNPGENEIYANLATPEGVTKNAIILVKSNAESPFAISPSPASGVAPFTTQFILLKNPDFLPATVSFDFDSDGNVDAVSSGYDAPIEFTYNSPGVYIATIVISDTNEKQYTLTNYIVAMDRSVLDAKLRSIYQSMLDNLMVGNVQGAMYSVNGVMREKFEQSFVDAGPELAKIIPKLGTIQGGGVFGDIAQYVIMREENGQPVYFTIYFMKGRDGIWRIGEM